MGCVRNERGGEGFECAAIGAEVLGKHVARAVNARVGWYGTCQACGGGAYHTPDWRQAIGWKDAVQLRTMSDFY